MGVNLVIGGSRGIGYEIVNNFLNNGERVLSISRNESNLKNQKLEQLIGDVLNMELPQIDEIDSITYCPGSINLKPIQALKEEFFRNDMEINYFGAVKVISNYARQLKKSTNVSIVLFSTVAVQTGMPFHASISSAKGALEGFGRSLAAELAPTVRVNLIAPSVTETDLAASLLKTEKSRENTEARHPLKRILSAKEIADLASFLHNSPGITGQIIQADNGIGSLRS